MPIGSTRLIVLAFPFPVMPGQLDDPSAVSYGCTVLSVRNTMSSYGTTNSLKQYSMLYTSGVKQGSPVQSGQIQGNRKSRSQGDARCWRCQWQPDKKGFSLSPGDCHARPMWGKAEAEPVVRMPTTNQ